MFNFAQRNYGGSPDYSGFAIIVKTVLNNKSQRASISILHKPCYQIELYAFYVFYESAFQLPEYSYVSLDLANSYMEKLNN